MKKLLLLLCLIALQQSVLSQVKIGDNPNTVNASSLLEMESTNKGLLIPRLSSAQRIAIASPAKGLMVFDSTARSFWFYNGNTWTEIKSDSTAIHIKDEVLQVSTDSTAKSVSSSLTSGVSFYDIFPDDNKLFIAAGTAGLRRVNSGATGTTIVYNTLGSVTAVNCNATHIYLIVSDSIVILNKTNYARLGALYISGAEKFTVSNNIAYIACGINGIKLVNLNNPAVPVVISSVATTYANDVYLSGDYLYVAEMNYMRIINVSNPLAPAITGNYYNGLFNNSVIIRNNYAYLSTSSSMYIVNVANPATPYIIALSYGGNHVAIEDTLGYQITSTGLRVLDFTNGTSLKQVSFATANLYCNRLAILGSYAYAIGYNGDIELYRIKGTSNSLIVTKDYVQMDVLSGNGTALVFADNSGRLTKPYLPTASFLNIYYPWRNNVGMDFSNRIKILTKQLNSYSSSSTRLDFYAHDGTFGNSIFSLSYEGGLTIDPDSSYYGNFATDNRVLRFGGINSKAGIGSSASYLQNPAGLNLYTNNISRLALTSGGSVVIDPSGNAIDNLTNGLKFGSTTSGEGITSNRDMGEALTNSLEFYTNSISRLRITNSGNIGIGTTPVSDKLEVAGNTKVSGNLTVQNGKGIIRTTDGTQLKKISANIAVTGSFAAGETRTFNIIFPENFSATPEVYVGNIVSGSGGWAEVIMTIYNVTTTGASLYVYNAKSTAVAPSFTVKIIGVGAQ